MLAIETVEHLDNNAFWDAESLDSIIFNSFVGAACIFEFDNGKIEAIRATERFVNMMSNGTMSVDEALKLDWGSHLDEDDKKLIRDAVLESKKTKAESTVELIFYDLPGCPHKTYARSTMHVIAKVGNRFVVYCLVENITKWREAQQKMRDAALEMKMMMDDTPGGHVRIRLNPDGKLSTIYVNEAYCRMRDMTVEEIFAADSDNALIAIHPDDNESALEVALTDSFTSSLTILCIASRIRFATAAQGRITLQSAKHNAEAYLQYEIPEQGGILNMLWYLCDNANKKDGCGYSLHRFVISREFEWVTASFAAL